MRYFIGFLLFLVSCNAWALRASNYSVMSGGNMSGSLTSSPISLSQNTMVSIQAVFTGTPVGTLVLMVSDDPGIINSDGTVSGLLNWSTYNGSSAVVNAPGNQSWDVWSTGARWMEVVYTPTSGSGTMSVMVNSKGQ